MTNDQITKKLESIQKEFQQLGGQISELASMSTERLEEYRNEAMGDVKDAAEHVTREAKKQVKHADEYAHDNPWAVIAGVSAVALLIGMLFSRRNK